MEKHIVVLDLMGSDGGPEVLLKGASAAQKKHPTLHLLLAGEEATVAAACEAGLLDKDRTEILSASQAITNHDDPTAAIFEKRDSSLVKALQYTKAHPEVLGLVCAGNTGALIAGAARYLLNEKKERPFLAATLPKESGGYVCLCDTGATVDCTPAMLLHFARSGAAFMKAIYHLDEPKVALLSNGAEEKKGNAVVKEAHRLLRAAEDITFIGNVEGTNVLSGICDVAVCDGFVGNQVLKVTEGTARRLITDIVRKGKEQGKPAYLALAAELKAEYDFNSRGGAVILGTVKPIIKAHGRASETTIENCLTMMLNLSLDHTIVS